MGKKFPEWLSKKTNSASNVLVEDTIIRSETEDLLEALEHEIDAVVAVSTNLPGSTFVERYDEADPCIEDISVIDASGNPAQSDYRVVDISSPEDLTTMGVKISEVLENYDQEEDVCLCFDSVSSVLTMMQTETVFRFLHVVTGRVRSTEDFGMFGIRPEVHDSQELATVEQLFDGKAVQEDGGLIYKEGGFIN